MADTWCEIAGLCAWVVAEAQGARTRVVVTTSLPIGRLQSPFSCSTQQVAQAARRRDEVLRRLGSHDIAAVGLIGDADPLLAVGDALAGLDAQTLANTRILVVTDSGDPRDWREHRLTERLEASYAMLVARRVVRQHPQFSRENQPGRLARSRVSVGPRDY